MAGVVPLSLDDLDAVLALVTRVIDGMRSQGIDQWDALYPDRAVLASDLSSGSGFGIFTGPSLVGYVCLNRIQSPEYAAVAWGTSDEPVLVIHRLCTCPQAQGRGLGQALVAFAQTWAEQTGARAIRLDAFSQNPRALGLYERNGYERRGAVRFRKGEFFVYEKLLPALEHGDSQGQAAGGFGPQGPGAQAGH
ncbi:MAG TPA: GNAT family N-acetyltransferase [Spirochaetia bacterium]|jgi:ribosomal protein S18 acetylase RimI-like enzyme|nr:GNAT family N-acetyltransferase [Spirochaetia bacterium]